MKTILRILNEITGEVFELWIKKRRIQSEITHLEGSKPSPNYENPEHPLLTLDELLRHLQQEHEHRRIIEDKAKMNVLGIQRNARQRSTSTPCG